MKQLTVRGLGDELTRAIRRLASRDGTSLNRAAVKLLRPGGGPGGNGIGYGRVLAGPPHRLME